jgi:hypothetical protein
MRVRVSMTSSLGNPLSGLLPVRPGRAANDNKKLTSDAIAAFDLINLRISHPKLKDSFIAVMAPSKLQKDDAVVIVGAGIFGLSTALHLASRGYTNVTVFDRQNYDETLYSYQKGCDAASAGEQNPTVNFTWALAANPSSPCRPEQDHAISIWSPDGIPGALLRGNSRLEGME